MRPTIVNHRVLQTAVIEWLEVAKRPPWLEPEAQYTAGLHLEIVITLSLRRIPGRADKRRKKLEIPLLVGLGAGVGQISWTGQIIDHIDQCAARVLGVAAEKGFSPEKS
jgi:hypothetical protein